MTKAEWSSSVDPEPMLAFAAGRLTQRQRRLFACACARRTGSLLGKEGRKAVRVAELWAAGRLDEDGARRARNDARRAVASAQQVVYRKWGSITATARLFAERGAMATLAPEPTGDGAIYSAAAVTVEALGPGPLIPGLSISGCSDAGITFRHRPTAYGPDKQTEQESVRRATDAVQDAWCSERQAQTELLRCLVRWDQTEEFNPRWRTSDVIGLARAIVDDGAFDRLPILADALVDAGCDHEDVLAHCRCVGPHGLGCWVVELALGDVH